MQAHVDEQPDHVDQAPAREDQGDEDIPRLKLSLRRPTARKPATAPRSPSKRRQKRSASRSGCRSPKPAPQAQAPDETAVSPDRAEKAVNMLRRALEAALAELGGLDDLDLSELDVPQASVPQAPPAEPAPEPVSESEVEKKVELPPGPPWVDDETQTPVARENWDGQVLEVTLGAAEDQGGTRKEQVVIGGETAMPFLTSRVSFPHRPVIAIEIARTADRMIGRICWWRFGMRSWMTLEPGPSG